MDFKLLYRLYLSTKYKSKAMFSLLTYEESYSPAMKQTIHIRGVDNLEEEINNIIQNEQGSRETCFIQLYKAIQIDEWDNIIIIND